MQLERNSLLWPSNVDWFMTADIRETSNDFVLQPKENYETTC